MLLCYLEFLGCRISGELDNLHPVQERLWDRVNAVGGADKEYVRQVVRNVHVVIGKRIVLFRIEDFEKCACRISVVGSGELVHFIEDHYGIVDTAFLNSVHDPAGHSAYICSPVPPDIRFISHSAETDSDIFSVQSFCDGLPDAGLACSGSSDEEKDGTRLLFLKVHDGYLLDDPVLDLFKTVMIGVEYLCGFIKIYLLWFRRLPAESREKVEVVIEHGIFVAVAVFLFHSVEDFESFLHGGLVHPGFLYLLLKSLYVRDVVRMHLIELFLQILHLLFDRGLPVEFLIVLFELICALPGEFCHLESLIYHGGHLFDSRAPGVLFDQHIRLIGREGKPVGCHAQSFAYGLPSGDIAVHEGSPLELRHVF